MSHSILLFMVLIALAATFGALVFGLFSLSKGGDFNRKYGNRAMHWRIGLQGLVIILFTLMLILGR